MATNETVLALQQASDGLSYQSETDAPWTAFSWPTAQGEVTGDVVRALANHKANAPIAETAIDEFFSPLVDEKDWYGDEEKSTSAKYRSLLNAIKSHLTNPKVVRVGKTKIAVYVVGQAKEGGWAGIKTTAVET